MIGEGKPRPPSRDGRLTEAIMAFLKGIEVGKGKEGLAQTKGVFRLLCLPSPFFVIPTPSTSTLSAGSLGGGGLPPPMEGGGAQAPPEAPGTEATATQEREASGEAEVKAREEGGSAQAKEGMELGE